MNLLQVYVKRGKGLSKKYRIEVIMMILPSMSLMVQHISEPWLPLGISLIYPIRCSYSRVPQLKSLHILLHTMYTPNLRLPFFLFAINCDFSTFLVILKLLFLSKWSTHLSLMSLVFDN